MRRIISLILVFLLLLSTSGCGPGAEEARMTVIFPEKFIGIAGQTPEGWVEALEDAGPDQYLSLTAEPESGSVIMEITETQRQFWKNTMRTALDKYCRELSMENPSYKVTLSSDYAQADFYYNLDLNAADAVYYVMGVETYCICMQLLNGADPDNWIVTMTIYNSDTGKTVTSGNSNEGLSYSAEDWEASK